ncbi:uncharacterized protein LOC141823910 [Curcuma longa]|uniref:uncharacterized protein LOC141823910 n=1 Tax=Curcuma longa TaxID=136217 RepID=UPI003D9EC82B
MAGTELVDSGGGSEEIESEQESYGSSSFVWDDNSKLYYHASSGFYHDPSAGWYYSSRDGLYYTFEDGRYVPLSYNEKGKVSEALDGATCASSHEASHDETFRIEENASADGIQNPPSEWLEDTLIDLYLSGYSNPDAHPTSSSTSLHTVDTSWEEENWQAQYGQVVRSGDEHQPSFPVIDLWDWEIIKEPAKKNNLVYKLIGRTVRCSNSLHPSVPAGGVLKTTPIREVHLDLVRVTSGKVYRLRSPNIRCLTSLSSYDSSNPTKDWGFPDLYDNLQSGISDTLSYPNCQPNHTDEVCDIWSSKLDNFPNAPEKHKNVTYKDRAAARRMLHGDFSVGPGQKDAENRSFHEPTSSSKHSDPEDAAAEAIKSSFGSGSYARRILKSMGWNDGEALGNSRKGILEPLRPVGNKGYAGLGWNNHIRDAT